MNNQETMNTKNDGPEGHLKLFHIMTISPAHVEPGELPQVVIGTFLNINDSIQGAVRHIEDYMVNSKVTEYFCQEVSMDEKRNIIYPEFETSMRVPANQHTYWKERQKVFTLVPASKGKMVDPWTPEGYQAILADPNLQLEWQDALDSTFGGRIVDVRNELRELGWEDYSQDRSCLVKEGISVAFRALYVGAGRNIVGGTWDISTQPGGWRLEDIKDGLCDVSAPEHADNIEASRSRHIERINANKDRQPQELLFSEFVEIADITKLTHHGRQWSVRFGERDLGFADGPHKHEALKEVHSREVSNAIYSHSKDSPDFFEKRIFPPDAVISEYAGLREEFADVFAARAPVLEGAYSGLVLDVTDGVATQRTGRAGETARHALVNLSKPVHVGELVNIRYSEDELADVSVLSVKKEGNER